MSIKGRLETLENARPKGVSAEDVLNYKIMQGMSKDEILYINSLVRKIGPDYDLSLLSAEELQTLRSYLAKSAEARATYQAEGQL